MYDWTVKLYKDSLCLFRNNKLFMWGETITNKKQIRKEFGKMQARYSYLDLRLID